jgi:hypothetical protein
VRGDDGVSLKVIGFQSFAQRSACVQDYDDPDETLHGKIEEGHLAFYGAFPVPDDLIAKHEICT